MERETVGNEKMRRNKDVMKTNKKKEIYKTLCERDGKRCHYCGIEEEDVIPLWRRFYGQDKRGKRLELDRKDNEKDYHTQNCVLACAVCNCAKSNKFTYEEFLKVGVVIKEIWQQREKTR